MFPTDRAFDSFVLFQGTLRIILCDRLVEYPFPFCYYRSTDQKEGMKLINQVRS